MSTQYKQLVDEWREAATRTRDAQRLLKVAFDAYISGGPAPSEQDVAALRQLRKVEGDKLEQAMDYIKRKAVGGPPSQGELG